MASPGRPKNLRPHDIHFAMPKDMRLYTAKRLYWALLSMEKKMSRDITSVKMSEYRLILEAYHQAIDELKEKGYKYGVSTTKRMEQQRLAENKRSGDAAGAGQDGSAGVGAGVSPTNPLA